MKKMLALALAMSMALSLAACGGGGDKSQTPPPPSCGGSATQSTPQGVEPDYDYTIRIYSNSNSTERTTWLIHEAKEAGFNISIDDNSVISGDTAAIQAANENKDGDLIFGLNETRWSQLVDGTYENLKIMDWTPSWSGDVGE